MFNKVKIVVIGPCQSGKSVISNFLADATDTASGDYRSTKGVRILEFEVDGVDIGGNHSVSIEVELWDCSGNQSYDMCWPAMQKDLNGIIFVYNPAIGSHEKELENWHLHFAKQQGLKDKLCMILAHSKPGLDPVNVSKLSGSLGRIRLVNTNLEDDPERVRKNFERFLSDVLAHINDSRDQEELSIIE